MNQSNATIRTRTIWKAVFLTISPMIFSGLAVYLLFPQGGGLESDSYQLIEQERDELIKERNEWIENKNAFLVLQNETDSLFKMYRNLNTQRKENLYDAVEITEDMKEIKITIEQKLNQFKSKIIRDTLFAAVYQSSIADSKLSIGYYDSKAETEKELEKCLEALNEGDGLFEQLQDCQRARDEYREKYLAVIIDRKNPPSSPSPSDPIPPCYQEKYTRCYESVKKDYVNFLITEISNNLRILTAGNGREREWFGTSLATNMNRKIRELDQSECR